MNVMVCKSCRKMYNSINGKKLCPECEELKRDEFKKVKDYIRYNKGAGVQEVSEACDVSTSQIIIWVREERLFFTDERAVRLPCMGCGKMINTGKYCSKCAIDMKNGFANNKETSSSDETGLNKAKSAKVNYISQTL